MFNRNPVFTPKNLKGKFCSSPWTTITVEGDGNVYSCLCAYWTNLPIGNLFTQSLTDICNNSENLKSLKNSVLDGSYGWCIEKDCNVLQELPNCGENPLEEFEIDQTSLPTNITLAIDANCNLKCPSCRVNKIFSDQMDPRVDRILTQISNDYKNFKKPVYAMLDGSGDIFVSRAYEKFLFGGQLPECWKLMLLTNGNLLTKKLPQIQSIAHQIDLITVSLDAGTKEAYAITRGGNFDLVVKGLEMLLANKIPVCVQFVLQQANYHELRDYKKLANSLGLHYGVQKIDERSHMSQEYWNSASLENNPNIDYTLLKDQLIELSNDPYCSLDGGVRWLLAKL